MPLVSQGKNMWAGKNVLIGNTLSGDCWKTSQKSFLKKNDASPLYIYMHYNFDQNKTR